MVICRLRKNAEFRLNNSPRQGSSSRRHENTSNLEAEDNSHNSHSVEHPIGTGSDSDQRERNEFCQTSSSHQVSSLLSLSFVCLDIALYLLLQF